MIAGRMFNRGTRRPPRLLPALLGVGLVLAACGAPRASAPAAAPPVSGQFERGAAATRVAATASASATVRVAATYLAASSAATTTAAMSDGAAPIVATTQRVVATGSTEAAPGVRAVVPAPAGPGLDVVVPGGAGAPAAPAPVSPGAQPVAERPAVAPMAIAATAGDASVSKAAASPMSLPTRASLGPLIYIEQTLNNCGPASVAEVLRYWGVARSQGQVQAVLRADGNPRGMEPYGVPAYARSLGMDALMGVNGDDTVVKALVANGFPVIVSQWVSATDHVAHYRPIEGYDDARGVFIASDPYLGPNHAIGYDEFDQIWQSGSRRFMVLYPPSKQALLQSVLAAAGWDKAAAYQADLAKLQRRVANQQDRFLAGNARWRSFGALSVAWDELQLGQLDAASAALREAEGQQANPVLVRWIAQAIANQR